MAKFETWERDNLNRFAHNAAKILAERKARIEALEYSMRQMLRSVDNKCSGESQFAIGVNAACDQHVVGLQEIMTEAGVSHG